MSSAAAVRDAAVQAGRSLYQKVPVAARQRVRPFVEQRLGEKVELRSLSFTPSAPVGYRPALRPFTVEAPTELFIPKSLAKYGLGKYEPYALDLYLALLEHTRRGAVLDIGANVGLYGLLATALGRWPVYSFEPTPRIAAAARRSAKVSGLPLRVEQAAVGEEVGTLTLYLSNTSDASNSLNPDFRKSEERIDVPTTTVDTFCAAKRLAPSLLKIDTETTEPAVLRGARRTITTHRPWILVEVLKGRCVGELDAAMEGHGYTYHHIDGPGPRPVAEQIVGKDGGDMYLLAPQPVPDSVWAAMNAWREVLAGVRLAQRSVEVSTLLLDSELRPLPTTA